MYSFSNQSKRYLSEAHEDLQVVFNEVIKYFDCSILCGYRNQEDQDRAYNQGFSEVKYPNSMHNKVPSHAVDVVPYPIDWNDVNRMRYFAGFVLGISTMLKKEGKISHTIVSGFDWDSDTELKDTRFQDAPHFQITI